MAEERLSAQEVQSRLAAFQQEETQLTSAPASSTTTPDRKTPVQTQRLLGTASVSEESNAANAPAVRAADVGDTGGKNRIDGTPNRDRIVGTDLADQIFAYEGDDSVVGRPSDDDIFGGAGNDNIAGQGGNDNLFGGDGNDIKSGRMTII